MRSPLAKTYVLGCGRRRQNAELGHHAKSIHNDASVLNAAILQAINDNSPDAHRPSCCGNAEKFTVVGAGPFKATGYFIVFRNLLLNGKDNIRKTGTYGAKDIFQTIKSRTLARQRNLLNHVFPDIVRCRFDVSICDNFIHKGADDRGIILCHSLPLPILNLNSRLYPCSIERTMAAALYLTFTPAVESHGIEKSP